MTTDYRVPSLNNFQWQTPVLDKDLTTSPANTAGNRYIMAACGGDWTGSTPGYIATGTGSGSTWIYTEASEGMIVFVSDEDMYYVYVTSWVTLDSLSVGLFDIDINGGLMPSANTPADNYYELDGNGDIEPKV